MNTIEPRGMLRAAALVLSLQFILSCSSFVQGVSTKEIRTGAMRLSEDGRVAWLAQSALPEEIEKRLSTSSVITLVHEATGVHITCPLLSEKNSYYFSNYGGLLRKGDRVALIFEDLSPAEAVLE